ncbi:MAG TPA: hypothetical protein VNM90_10260 [Haliangium sp.]|nr:hypothetical protein [Haliangium sp.]
MYRATEVSDRRDPRVAAPSSRLPRPWIASTCVALTWLAFAGCSGGPGSGEPDAGPVAMAELGTGMFDFERLADGQVLDLISGPQGGFHFVVHARMRGLTPGDPRQPGLPENPTTIFRALDENGVRVDVPELRQLGYAPDPQVGGWYALPSGRILLIDNLRARTLYGRRVTIELQLQDSAGRMAGDTVRITAVAFPPDAGPGRDPVDAGPADAAPAGDSRAGQP